MMKQAMIFAAGLGTRLKPLTDHMPKALVEVDGQPLLERVIKRLADGNFDHLVVNVHHFSGQIIDFLRDHDNFGLDIQVSDETDALLDTGGGIRKAQQLFDLRYPILIHNVDILSNAPIAAVECDAVDMGTMAGSAERVSRTLRITNAGRSTLPIRRIYSTAPWLVCITCPVSQLAAGESTEVTIDVDVTKIEGTFINESITLITGDPIHPKRTIRLVGLVDRAK